MQVHCDEGVAIHIGPEPCVGVREHLGEASAGEIVGQVLSRENRLIPGADAMLEAEGNTDGCATASPERPGVVVDPGMRRSSLYRNWEISRLTMGDVVRHRPGSASGRRGAEADDARS